MVVFAVFASIVSLAFSMVVANKFSRSRRPEFLAWCIGLLFFALAAAFQSVGEIQGFSVPVFRGFYLFGGAFGVIYLALGTVFLLMPKTAARIVSGVVVLASVPVLIDALTVKVDAGLLDTAKGIMGNAISHGSLLFVAVVLFNIVGTLILVGGSAWSAFKLIRTHARMDLLVCNVLLTIGASIIGAGFSVAKTAGLNSVDELGLYELVGIIIMFAGFLALGRVGVTSRATTPSPAGTR